MTTDEKEPELKPCPFCGHRNPELTMWAYEGYIRCGKCKARTDSVFEPLDNKRRYDLIAERWNTRS